MSNVEQEADNRKRNSEEIDVVLKNQQMVRVQQMATVEWIHRSAKTKIQQMICEVGDCKTMSLNKLERHRFAFAIRISRRILRWQ
ncbi:hypothetical protein F511_34557 [Dorcoceras hygrometricum]|uniref:Uncharacterized protein n=1 Tax=Dorcoceras hygrometricum TaxID=472368 RepID=A0A2Z7BJ41_9LAMI|nr:hypothetical protein F511_34557 [Dorcoceras hygrometricum]